MIAVIGAQAEDICRYLQHDEFQAIAFSPEQIPSLTALLLDREEITDIVIQIEHYKEWSLGHILAAAKHLQVKGRLIFLGRCHQFPELISIVPDKDSLLKLLKRPIKPKAGDSGGHQALHEVSAQLAQHTSVVIQPLQVPPEKILILGVIGSQRRIGCTTQAIALWHYCKALGFDAAVVSSTEQIAAIAGSMHNQEISGGYRIEGIPFVTDTALTYDCYILDIEPGNIQEALYMTDYLMLVAGSKPWELQYTAAALRAARGKEMLVALSFSSQSDADCLQPLFGRQTVAVLPWLPDLWHPPIKTLAFYDTILRPVLKRIIFRDKQQQNDERQATKGD